MECEEIIHNILNSMGFKFETPDQLVESWNKCLVTLCQLGEECSDSLIQIGQELLDHVDENDSKLEYKLWMVLEAITRRNQAGALELTAAAIFNEKTKRKEEYVDILAHFEDPQAIPALIYAIEVDHSTGDMGGWTRSKAIDALFCLNATEVASIIIPYVQDSVYRVRSSAVNFLVNLDIRSAAPIFIEQIAKENDPDNLEDLIAGLVLWQGTDSLPILKGILESNWAKADEDLRTVVEEAISDIETIDN